MFHLSVMIPSWYICVMLSKTLKPKTDNLAANFTYAIT